ncbi:MAG TPA: tetratricopeptide repeat protein [Thermoanaerobaculia bacterium]|jgi:tetratricopeptide (TPR) repeat protein|nr:tetratricopeptide repeat protein [Thermoanaerobaculia bacterium]
MLAALATLAVYWTTTSYRFLLDDVFLFKSSPSLQTLSSIPLGFVTDLGAVRNGSTTVQGSFYRPLFLALSTLYFQLVGPSTFGWHLASVILAAGVAALAAVFFRRLRFPPLAALLAAMVFALHPAHVSSVAWASGIQEQLAALFVLVAMLALLSPGAEDRPKSVLAVSAAAFVLALLCKEVSIALFPMAAVWALAKRRAEPAESRRFARAAALFAGVAIVYLAVRLAVLGALARPWAEAPGFVRAAPSLPLAFVTYVHLLVWPTAFSFVRPERPIWGPFDLPVVISVAVLAVLAALAYLGIKRQRELLLPVAWFVVWLIPVMNFWAMFPEWMVTDRYLYLPSLALPWAMLVLLPRRASVPTLGVLAVVFAVLAWRYAAIFVDPKTFATAMEKAEPTSSYIIEEKARVFLVEGKRAAAEAAFRRALELDPWDAYSLWFLGNFERERGDFDAARLHYRRALVEEPNNSAPFTVLAHSLARAGQEKKALALLNETVWRWPEDFEPRLLQAVLLAKAGDRPRAEEAFAAARRVSPQEPRVAGGLDQAVSALAPSLAPR